MRLALRLVTVLGLMAVAFGCHAQLFSRSKIDPERMAKIKTVACISLIGDRLRMAYLGTTVFHNKETDHPVPEWRIDDRALELTEAALERGGYKVVRPHYDAAALRRVLDEKFRLLDVTRIEGDLRAIDAAEPVDVLLVLARLAGEPPYPMSGVSLQGFGLFGRVSRGTPPPAPWESQPETPKIVDDGPTMYAAFTNYTLHVIDGKTLKEIARGVGTLPTERSGSFFNPNRASAMLPIDPKHYKWQFSEFTPEDLQVIRTALEKMFATSVTTTLGDLGFKTAIGR